MNKTVFRLDREVSIIILSAIVMLFVFLSGYSQAGGLISLLFISIKAIIFVVVPFGVYLLEKNNLEFKKVAAIYTSYFLIDLLVSVFASISIVNGEVLYIWKLLFDFVNLVILLTSLFILIEQVLDYGGIKNKVYSNTIMKVVYLTANFVSYPFIMFFSKKNDNKLDD